MAHQIPDTLNYRVGPQPGGPLYVPDAPNNRKGPQVREPSKCPNGQSYGERLAKEAFLSPATRGSKKDSDRTITPGAEAVMSLRNWHTRVPASQTAEPPSRSTLTGAELPQAKKVLHPLMKDYFGCVQLFVSL